MRRSVSTLIVSLATVLLLSGCSTGPTANATEVKTVVDVAHPKSAAAPISQTTPVNVGDTVSTNAKGLAQLVYADGSITRLGPATKLKIVTLSNKETQRTVTSLNVGEIWNRVTKLAGSTSEFKVNTPVGVASVRGTAFDVACTAEPSCTITVLEGVVAFTPTGGEPITLSAYQRLVVPAATGQTPVATVLPEDATTTGWLKYNAGKDTAAGKATLPPASNPNDASLAGTWMLTETITSAPGSTYYNNIVAGTTYHAIWTIDPTVCDQARCEATAHSNSGKTITLLYGPDGFTDTVNQTEPCTNDQSGQSATPDATTSQTNRKLSVVEHHVLNGIDKATRISGTQVTQITPTADGLANCGSGIAPGTEVDSFTLVRQ